ncbi:protein EFR3 homolog B-like isoform X7 [Narcine bancroftii]|uniref:protein EFR3 homolog B-like isoform X7 n=1 Tax=Narcine bancroftii TaxID=1343680 RepID=UPI003831D80C
MYCKVRAQNQACKDRGRGVCGCCGALRPRYKRLVDNIFPEDSEDGLVKANMEKLTFYALSAPEKLDRIGAYLAERLSRDVARHRYGYVCIAMEALDQLLMACHCQSINLFVESFLKMVAKLLESDKAALQILGTNSFIKFANIEEDTPSYHRSYDFFVSRFSEMCHSGHDDVTDRTKIRMSGIKGLQGVVRKTINDELQVNIWEPQHMDKIVPSLLFNLQQVEDADSRSPSPLQAAEKEESPAALAEGCLRELLGRAAYGNIKNAIKPVLMHLDNHSLWEPKLFAVHCFKIIMYSVQNEVPKLDLHKSRLKWEKDLGRLIPQDDWMNLCRDSMTKIINSQHSHLVIQQLVGHLDANSKSIAKVRTGIVEVLSESAVIAAGGSVGPTVLEVFNTLLRHLRLSIDYEVTGKSESSTKISNQMITEHEERVFQEAVIKTIGAFANTLPAYQRSEVMLFIMGKVPLPAVHQALDMRKPGIISDISVLKLKVDKCSRQDTLFMKKHSQTLYRYIYMSCKEQNNSQNHYNVIYALLALISVELANEEVVVDLIRVVLALQELSMSNEDGLPVWSRCAMHALSAAYLNFISQLTTLPAFCQSVQQVIGSRQKEAPYLLPEGVVESETCIPQSMDKLEMEMLFLQSEISEVLAGSGYSSDRLGIPYIPQFTDEDRLSKRKSIGETISLQVEVESRNSPEKEEKIPAEEITYETLKKAIDSMAVEEQERERRQLVVEKFQKAPFEEIAAHCGARATILQSRLNQIFEITVRPPPSPSGNITASYGQTQPRSVPVYEMKFPDLCVY